MKNFSGISGVHWNSSSIIYRDFEADSILAEILVTGSRIIRSGVSVPEIRGSLLAAADRLKAYRDIFCILPGLYSAYFGESRLSAEMRSYGGHVPCDAELAAAYSSVCVIIAMPDGGGKADAVCSTGRLLLASASWARVLYGRCVSAKKL